MPNAAFTLQVATVFWFWLGNGLPYIGVVSLLGAVTMPGHRIVCH
jgi:hypothetical protein